MCLSMKKERAEMVPPFFWLLKIQIVFYIYLYTSIYMYVSHLSLAQNILACFEKLSLRLCYLKSV